jgi:type I restriction enzyme M protein
MINKILTFIESHTDQMNQMDSLAFLYLLHVWKKLSDAAAIPEEIRIEKYTDGKVQLGQMGTLFVNLANYSDVFYAQVEKHSWKYNADNKTLNDYILFVSENIVFPNVSEIFNALFERQGSKSGEFAQPEELVDLLVKIADQGHPKSVYIPFTSGTLLAGELGKDSNKKLYLENTYLNPVILELSRYLDHVNIEYVINNPIYDPAFFDLEARTLNQFDVSVAIPPFGGIKAEQEIANIHWDRYRVADTLNGSSRNGEIALIEHTLSQTTGRAIFVISHGLLFRSSTDRIIREQLLASKQIEAVITLPGNLFIQSVIPTAILVLNNQRTFNDVLFIDASKMMERTGKKNVLTDIDMIIRLLETRESVEDISAVVSYDEMLKHRNSLNPSRYIVSINDQNIQNILDAHNTKKLDGLVYIHRSQQIKDEKVLDGIEYRMVMASDFPECGFLTTTEQTIRVKEQKSKAETYRLCSYDILLGVKGSVGKVAIIGDIGESHWVANQSFMVLSRFLSKETSIFLYMYLKSTVGQQLLAAMTAGASVPQIPTSALKDLKVPFLERELEDRALKHFYEEIEIYNEIEVLKDKISNINKHFFGQES